MVYHVDDMPEAQPTPTGRSRFSAALRRARRRVADRKAGWLARWVQDAPDARLELGMRRGPLRTIVLWQIFTTMSRRCEAGRQEAVVEFRIRRPGGGAVDRHRLVLERGRCTAVRGGGGEATVVLELDWVSFLRLAGGAAAPAGLLVRGRLRVRGSLLLAARLPGLLDIPGPPPRRR